MKDLFSTRAKKLQRSELAELFKLAEQPDVISFAGGLPDPEWFLPEIDDLTAQIMKENRGVALQYGPTPGLTACREFVARRLQGRGVKAEVPNVLITSGALQGLEIVARILLDPGDIVIVEAPTYIGTIQTLESLEAMLVSVPVDRDGMRVDVLDDMLKSLAARGQRAKFIYTIPTFQNPSGCTLSEERRGALIATASLHGVPVVEDDAYGELRYSGKALPLLKALDVEDNVIHLGTFSKVFSPGVRLGWMVASPEIIEKAIIFKQGTDQCSGTLAQLMAIEYGKRGLIEKQIGVTVNGLVRKCRATLDALSRHFPAGSAWTIPQGGFYTWASVSGGIDTVALLPRAVKETKTAYVAGPSFYADRRGANELRVCFSLVKEDLIDEGIKRLGELFGAAGR